MSSAPFLAFASALEPQSPLRAAISAATRRPEPGSVAELLEAARLPAPAAAAVAALARELAAKLRERSAGLSRDSLAQALMQQFALSSDEGIALMCVAEALLRIPDAATRDALIRDKVTRGDWQSHLNRSESIFVNAATWGLFLTGRLSATHSEHGLANALRRAIVRHGEPLLRKGVEMAMRLMAEQFVTGETIAEALEVASRREAQGFRYSYDMLGEAAMTEADAERYFASYADAIHAIGDASPNRGIYQGPGISIKLSALHPRYTRSQRDRVLGELYPRLRELTLLAKRYDVGVNIDAEEADRLDLSLDALERLSFEPGLASWDGIGFVVQAYQKRCPFVIDYVIDLAGRSARRIMVRLVKGAYWDTEIKRAQVEGLEGYPVYTRKVYTDISYLACARKLLAAPKAVYPQFATHNAHTVAAIYSLAGADFYPGQYEFQCLHGMGEPLYEHVVGAAADGKLDRPCRIYAPVGTQRTLLPYLVRRLLENGANTSFVNRIADPATPLDSLVADPVAEVEALARSEGAIALPHPRIPLARHLFEGRLNSAGRDLADERVLRELAGALVESSRVPVRAHPTIAGDFHRTTPAAVLNPANAMDVVGHVYEASAEEAQRAIQAAVAVAPAWQAVAPSARAAILERAADAMERDMPAFMALAVREAGKSLANAVAEAREAADFLRYYAAQARSRFDNDTHAALGPIACISPWNFPLAIFTGQVGAALAAGNPVLAKPAEQTPLIAARAVRVLHEAGVPADALQLVPGRGETIGAALVADPRIEGVIFTGSSEVARAIERTLSARIGARGGPVPLIAETGGQNAMIVDSSALAEQAVADAVHSAFDSAGQRCSALRVLCLQEDIAERVLEMLRGAMDELVLGSPDDIAVDVGPVIDEEARASLAAYIESMRNGGRPVYQSSRTQRTGALDQGTFVPPTLIEIDSVRVLEREVFGPVLHVVRYARDELDTLIDGINALGFGLTLGVHSRIDETILQITGRTRVGNVYVNRNMIGAVVGVQPFGGEGLSGTGPKAGGPLYMYRLLSSYPEDAVVETVRALAGDAGREKTAAADDAQPGFEALRAWCAKRVAGDERVPPALFDGLRRANLSGVSVALPGPTGESNTYVLTARRRVLCLAERVPDLIVQLAAVLAIGSRAVWPASDVRRDLRAQLPESVRERIELVDGDSAARNECAFDAVLYHGGAAGLSDVLAKRAARDGPIVPVNAYAAGDHKIRLQRLLVERVISVNTAAAGGNASLMTIG